MIVLFSFVFLILVRVLNMRGKKFCSNDKLLFWILYVMNTYFFYHMVNVYHHGYFLPYLSNSFFLILNHFSLKTFITLLIAIPSFSIIYIFVSVIIGNIYISRDEDQKIITDLEKHIVELENELEEANQVISELQQRLYK